jgi:hypothetical protein
MAGKNYIIEPPPKDKGKESLFRVVYAIDVDTPDAAKAAEKAWQMMKSDDSLAPILVVLDSSGNQTAIDLSDILEFNKITTGFVCQKYRKDDKGNFVCIHQEFIAGDDVQFENLKGDPIETPPHDYQPFNMTLLSRDQIVNRLGNVLTSIDVGGEQSRQFDHEIKIMEELLKDIGWTRD